MATAEYMVKYREENRDAISERRKKHYQENRDRILLQSKLKKYDITEEHHSHMMRMQDGECVICGGDNDGETLHIDHNHDTLQVRDMLCRSCNVVIGYMEEDPDRLRAVADYLEEHEQRAA